MKIQCQLQLQMDHLKLWNQPLSLNHQSRVRNAFFNISEQNDWSGTYLDHQLHLGLDPVENNPS